MSNKKNLPGLALLAVLCVVMVAMGIWGFALGGTVTLSAAELAAPTATEAPAEEVATEEAVVEETAEEAAGEELAEAAGDSGVSLQESAIAEHLAERSGLQSFAYLKRFPLLITGVLLGVAFVVALLISGK